MSDVSKYNIIMPVSIVSNDHGITK